MLNGTVKRISLFEYVPIFLHYRPLFYFPDEEIGGVDGMQKFVHMKEFRDLNVGFALDEGMASKADHFILFPGERSIWREFQSKPFVKTNFCWLHVFSNQKSFFKFDPHFIKMLSSRNPCSLPRQPWSWIPSFIKHSR